jgi:hypothetical protein
MVPTREGFQHSGEWMWPRAPSKTSPLACALIAWQMLSPTAWANARRSADSVPHPTRAAMAPQRSGSIEGKVVEVGRTSRHIAIRTRGGALERVMIPTGTLIEGPHAAQTLGRIHAGVDVRVVTQVDPHGRIIARHVVVRQPNAADESRLGPRIGH